MNTNNKIEKWSPSPDTPTWLTERRHPAVLNPLKIKLLPNEFCYYCGLPLVEARIPLGQCPPDNLKTWDHKTPTARGGPNTRDNLVSACYGCNSDKANMTLEEWRLVLAYREGIIRDASHVYKFWAEENEENLENSSK